MKGGGDYQVWGAGGQVLCVILGLKYGFCGLSSQHTHQSLNGQQGRCVMAQVGPGIHDGVDLFDC